MSTDFPKRNDHVRLLRYLDGNGPTREELAQKPFEYLSRLWPEPIPGDWYGRLPESPPGPRAPRYGPLAER